MCIKLKMRMKYILITIIAVLSFSACQTSRQVGAGIYGWHNVAVTEDMKIYTDTLNLKQDGAVSYAYEKRIYTSAEARKAYVDKIRDRYVAMKKPEKAEKWNDFSYCIYYSMYDCSNRRFRVLSVEDYDSSGKLIQKTVTSKDKLRWLEVNAKTVGDYTFFFVCDYGK